MNRPPAYPAARAANVMLGVAVVVAATLAFTGRSLLREGSATGWLMYAIALVAIFTAGLIRWSVGRPRG